MNRARNWTASLSRPGTRVSSALASPVVAASVVLLLLTLRLPELLFRAEFYADDGVMYGSALAEGITTVFEPYAGYLIVGQRLIVLLETLAPPAFAPLLGSIVAASVLAGAAALAASPRMPWDRRTGWLVAVGIALLPASYPIVGNLAHVIWPVMLAMAFTAISREPRWRVLESGGLLVAGLTGPGALVLWPLFLSGPRRRLAIVGLAATVQGVVILSEAGGPVAVPDPNALPVIILIRGIVTPLLGPSITTTLGPALLILLGVPLLVCLLRLAWTSPLRWQIGYTTVAIPAAGLLMAGAPAEWYVHVEQFARYFWIPSAMLVVLIVMGRRRIAAWPLTAALLVGMASEARISPWDDMQWSERSACIGGPVACEVPIAPAQGWAVRWDPARSER